MRSNNNLIVKNTMMLYFRMMFQMAVTLYTSRVILKALGQSDYGIYDVVGGVIIVVSFLNNAMALSTQRFITFHLGRDDAEYSRKVFSTALVVQLIVASLIILVGETLGLWFFFNYMNFPKDRMMQASVVFHLSLLSSAISIVGIPYYASIIAHERMGVFSVISIIETILKLLIAIILPLFAFDHLVLYGIFMLAVVVIIRIIYMRYCYSNFSETKFQFSKDKSLFKEMMGFAGWSLVGNMSFVAYTQGTNILLNIFFGPVVNAARGIAFQVQTAISSFITNFQIAINPQIVKSYSSNELNSMHRLIFSSAKFSFLLMLMISLPIMVEMPFILKIWLGQYPQHSVIFCRLLICSALMTSISNPLQIGINSTGRIKKYNVVIGSSYISIIPISYLALKFGAQPYVVFIIQFAVLATSIIFLVRIGAEQFNMSTKKFVQEVLMNISLVALLSFIVPCILQYYINEGFIRLCIVTLSSLGYSFLLIWHIGLTKEEKIMMRDFYSNFIKRFQK